MLCCTDKPGLPEDLLVSDVNKESCTLKWNKPNDDGGSAISQYIIEKCDLETGYWQEVGKKSGTKIKVYI